MYKSIYKIYKSNNSAALWASLAYMSAPISHNTAPKIAARHNNTSNDSLEPTPTSKEIQKTINFITNTLSSPLHTFDRVIIKMTRTKKKTNHNQEA